MHTYNKQYLAWMLIFSHTLTSCLNPTIGPNKKHLALTENQTPTQKLTQHRLITSDWQPIYLVQINGSWQARITKEDHSKQVPVIWETGYSPADIANDQTGSCQQYIHIITHSQEPSEPKYVYIGRQADIDLTDTDEAALHKPAFTAKQIELIPSQTQARTSASTTSHSITLYHQAPKQLLSPQALIQKTDEGQAPSNNQKDRETIPPTQPIPLWRSDILSQQPPIKHSPSPVSPDRKKTISLPATNALHARQQIAYAKEKAAKKAGNKESPIHLRNHSNQALTPKPGEPESSSRQPIRPTARIILQTSIELKQDHVTINFQQEPDSWIAYVEEHWPSEFKRQLTLPVYGATSLLKSPDLGKHDSSWCKYPIQVCWPEQDLQRGRGYVYLGSIGLPGGGPAKASSQLKNITIKRGGPFASMRAEDRVDIKEIAFIPQQGLWWADITYKVFSDVTKKWRTQGTAMRIPVETDQTEEISTQDLATGHITINYTAENANVHTPVPVFHHIKIEKSPMRLVQDKEEAEETSELEEDLHIEEAAAIEESIYQKLMESLFDSLNNPELVADNQKRVQQLLGKMHTEGKTPTLMAETKAVVDYLAELDKILKFRHKATDDLYFGPGTSDYINQRILQGFQELHSLEKSIQSTEEDLGMLCQAFGEGMPDLKLNPSINKNNWLAPLNNQKILLAIINRILESIIPGGKLIQVILGLTEQPQTWEEWLPITIETALDFLPRGKATVFTKILTGKSTINEFKKLLISQARKKAKQLEQANKKKRALEAKQAEKVNKNKNPLP